MLRISMISLACILLVLGCRQKESNKQDAEGNILNINTLEPITYTIYSDKIELFVEFRPLVKGEQIKFAIHYTVVGETFKPLDEGALTLSLINGDKGIRVKADSLSSPGIFQLSLSPNSFGKATLIFDLKAKDFEDQIIIKDVPIYQNLEEALKSQEDDSHADAITYLKEQSWNNEFATLEVTSKPFTGVIHTSGQFINTPEDEAVITATANGIVKLNFNGLEGTAVNAGQRLFTISSKEMTTNNTSAAIAEASVNLQKAKSNFDRATLAVKDKIIAESEYLSAKSAYENARIIYNQLSNNQNGNGKAITSPKSGFIKNLLVTDGSYVNEGSPIASVTANKNIILQANLYQNDLAYSNAIVGANFKVAGTNDFYNSQDINGKVISVGKVISNQNPSVPVLIQLNNVGAIYPGAFADIYLKIAPNRKGIIIPKTAIIEEQGNYFTYVQLAGESFEKRKLTLGVNDGINVEVISGLEEGERIVSKGGYMIKLISASGALPAHGHEH